MNGAVSKTAIPKGIGGSNPPISAKPMALFKKQQPEEQTPQALRKKVQALEKRLEQTAKELEQLKQQTRQAVTRVGIVRFNPFAEMGGDQSFAVALLNEEHTGFVLTSYYGKDLNRVFAKPVQKGSSRYELSDEEREALEKAMGVEKPKSKRRKKK